MVTQISHGNLNCEKRVLISNRNRLRWAYKFLELLLIMALGFYVPWLLSAVLVFTKMVKETLGFHVTLSFYTM